MSTAHQLQAILSLSTSREQQMLTPSPLPASNTNGTGPVQQMRASPAPPGGFRTPQAVMTPNGNAPSPAGERRNPASEGAGQYQGHSNAATPGQGQDPQYFPNQGQNQGPAQQTVSSSNPKIAAQAAADNKNIVRRKLTGYVGFANLPNQWHRKSVRKGFNFNVMVVGMSKKNLPS